MHAPTWPYFGIWLASGSDETIAIYPQSAWLAGHDLTVECWGTFQNELQITVNDYVGSNYVELADLTLGPPATNRIKFVVAAAEPTPTWHFAVKIANAPSGGTGTTNVWECRVTRDAP